jgi:hypothetical protein
MKSKPNTRHALAQATAAAATFGTMENGENSPTDPQVCSFSQLLYFLMTNLSQIVMYA